MEFLNHRERDEMLTSEDHRELLSLGQGSDDMADLFEGGDWISKGKLQVSQVSHLEVVEVPFHSGAVSLNSPRCLSDRIGSEPGARPKGRSSVKGQSHEHNPAPFIIMIGSNKTILPEGFSPKHSLHPKTPEVCQTIYRTMSLGRGQSSPWRDWLCL